MLHEAAEYMRASEQRGDVVIAGKTEYHEGGSDLGMIFTPTERHAHHRGRWRLMSDEKPLEVSFYHLQMQPLERVLPVLLERSLERGWNVVLQTVTEQRCIALNEALWTYSDESFLPHGMARDGDAEFQPIYLTNGPENPNGAQIRFFVEGAEIAPILSAAEEPYERCVLMFDGNNEDELARARAQWKALKALGLQLSLFPADRRRSLGEEGVMSERR